MNLKALYETQAKLDADILVKHPVQEGEDRLSKKMLALQVELGELANEIRTWKFWSNDQEPRTSVEVKCDHCGGNGVDNFKECKKCDGWGKLLNQNLVLGEYVDGLHFILNIGNDLNLNNSFYRSFKPRSNIEEQLMDVFIHTSFLAVEYRTKQSVDFSYKNIMNVYLGLGEMLGFSWEQIEHAYYEKNKINLERQENGY